MSDRESAYLKEQRDGLARWLLAVLVDQGVEADGRGLPVSQEAVERAQGMDLNGVGIAFRLHDRHGHAPEVSWSRSDGPVLQSLSPFPEDFFDQLKGD